MSSRLLIRHQPGPRFQYVGFHSILYTLQYNNFNIKHIPDREGIRRLIHTKYCDIHKNMSKFILRGEMKGLNCLAAPMNPYLHFASTSSGEFMGITCFIHPSLALSTWMKGTCGNQIASICRCLRQAKRIENRIKAFLCGSSNLFKSLSLNRIRISEF